MKRVDDEGVLSTADGRRLGYLVRGPQGGRPVVYLHGMPSSRREQRLFPQAALDRFGIRLISIDRPGYGDTDPLEGDRITRVADVLALCDALEIPSFPLIAASSGGSYSLTLAAVAAERVERLVLVSAQMPYDDEAAIQGLQPEQLALVPAMRMGRIQPVVDGTKDYCARMLADPMAGMAPMLTTLTPRERRWLDQPWVREVETDNVIHGLRASADGVLDDLLTWPRPFEVDLTAVNCAVRAVHGTADDWEPLPNLQRILRQLSDVQLILLDGLNHFGPLLYPDLVMSLAISDD